MNNGREKGKTGGYLRVEIQTAALVLCLVLALGNFVAQGCYIQGNLPYVGAIDEPAISGRAANIVRSGDLNPRFFHYPSLPIYMIAAGMETGLALSGQDLGKVGFPYYHNPTAIFFPKLLFSFLASLSLVFLGLISRRLLEDQPALTVLAPATLSLSGVFFYYSAQYLNVDIIGFFWILALFAWLMYLKPDSGTWRRAVIPGFLVGLAASSKYGLGIALLPALMATILEAKEKKKTLLVMPVAAAVGFLATSPYVLLDFSSFWEDFTFENRHYREGHYGFDGPRGLPQILHYIKIQLADFGAGSSVFFLLGQFVLWRRDWKKTLILYSFPVLLLLLLSGYRVNFLRNALPIHAFYALSVAVGLMTLFFGVRWAMNRWVPRGSGTVGAVAGLVVLAVSAALVLPLERPAQQWRPGPDTRNLAVMDLEQMTPGQKILIPRELQLDPRKLEKIHEIHQRQLFGEDPEEFMRFVREEKPDFVLWPHFEYDTRKPDGLEQAEKLNGMGEEFRIWRKYRNLIVEEKILASEPTVTSGQGVLVNYSMWVPGVNPIFYLAEPLAR